MRESRVQEEEKKFIATLQDRLAHMESRAKELELENENYVKEIRELHTSIISTEKQTENYKEQTQDMEIRINKLKQENKHCEKKLEMMQRKLQKSEKEKKRALNRQRNAEMKLVEYQQELCSNTSSAVTAGNNFIGQTENEARMMKLKLESTQAKLSMIEGTKSFMESKIKSLERKVGLCFIHSILLVFCCPLYSLSIFLIFKNMRPTLRNTPRKVWKLFRSSRN